MVMDGTRERGLDEEEDTTRRRRRRALVSSKAMHAVGFVVEGEEEEDVVEDCPSNLTLLGLEGNSFPLSNRDSRRVPIHHLCRRFDGVAVVAFDPISFAEMKSCLLREPELPRLQCMAWKRQRSTRTTAARGSAASCGMTTAPTQSKRSLYLLEGNEQGTATDREADHERRR